MIEINEITLFLGWCLIINVCIFVFTLLLITIFKGILTKINQKLFAIQPPELARLYFKYLSNYKLGILIFNLVPYLSLKLMI